MSSAHQVILAVIHRFFESNFKKSIVLSYDIVAADCMSFAATFFGSLSIVGVGTKEKKGSMSIVGVEAKTKKTSRVGAKAPA